MRINKKRIMLGLMLLCCVHGTREELMAQLLKEELKVSGLNLVGGPWYLDDDESLIGMLGRKAVWGELEKDGKWLLGYDKDGELLGWWNEYGTLLPEEPLGLDEDRTFTFDTPADIRDLAQKLRSGKCQYSYSLILYKDFSQLIKSGFKKVSCLYLDPLGFFFSIEQAIPEYFGCWTLNEDFFKASASPEKMVEFEKQLESARRQQKVTQGELELELTKHKAEVARLEAIITTTRNESTVLKELFSVACKKAEDDKQELHLLLQQTMSVIGRQTGLINGIQEMMKSLVARASGLPPEFMDLLADMSSAGPASSESH